MFCRIMVAPTLLYGSETWNSVYPRSKQNSGSRDAFITILKGCIILDKIKNENFKRELKTFNLWDKIVVTKINKIK